MSGMGNTAPFQRSGRPVVVNGTNVGVVCKLEYVSKAIVVSCAGGHGTISFAGDAEQFKIANGTTVRLEVACLEFTLTSEHMHAVVELTNIPRNSLDPTGLEVDRGSLVTVEAVVP